MGNRLIVVITMTVFLAACAERGIGQKEGAGTLVGAGLGALAGSKLAGARGNSRLIVRFGHSGNEIGKSLDKADQAKLPSGKEARRHRLVRRSTGVILIGKFRPVTPVREGRHVDPGIIAVNSNRR